MNIKPGRLLSLLISFTLLVLPQMLSAQTSTQGPTNRLTINANGVGGNASSGRATISSNGRVAVFESNANNLVPGDTNNRTDIFIRNQKTGEIRRVSEGAGRLQSNGNSFDVSISPESPNGFVALAFSSDASNLIPLNQLNDTNGATDIYVHFPVLQFTMRVSVPSASVDEADGDSREPSITAIPSPKQVLVTYASDATNLVDDDMNGVKDIFLSTIASPGDDLSFNPITGIQTIRVSDPPSGGESNGDSSSPKISGNGKFIVFQSTATNLVAGISDTNSQIYLYSVDSGEITLISKAADGTPGDANSASPTINFSGTVIAYKTRAMNILDDAVSVPAGASQTVIFDTQKGTTQRINVTPDGMASNGQTGSNVTVDLSPSGRLVIFGDSGSNLVSGDTNGAPDVFVKDTVSGELFRISKNTTGGNPNGFAAFPSFGQTSFNTPFGLITYTSNASNLIQNDTEGNTDVFLTEFQFPPRPLGRGTRLDVPPDVTLTGKKAVISLESFDGVSISTKSKKSRLRKSATRTRTVYKVTIKQVLTGGRKKTVKRKNSKRSTVTIRRLKTGTYTSSYRATIVRGTKTISRTASSPEQTFTVD